MPVLTDETLMALADGALDGELRARVEALLVMDEESLRRVEIFRATGARLQNLYLQPMYEPVPAHMVDFVLQFGRDSANPQKVVKRRKNFLSAWAHMFTSRAVWEKLVSRTVWQSWLPASVTWQLAMASVAALAIGAGTGFMLQSGTADGTARLAAFKDGQIFAGGALRQVLESNLSQQESLIAGGSKDAIAARPILTFKTKGGSYCREYEITAAAGNFSGLACRDAEGKWAVQANLAESVKPEAPRPAGPAVEQSPLDPVVDRVMDGIAFGKKEEEAAIAKNWRQ